MSMKDAFKFFEQIEKDASFRTQIENVRNEEECLKIIREQYHLQFTEPEFRKAFEEKYKLELQRENLHKLSQSGILSSKVCSCLPFHKNKPHHGE